MTIVAWVILGLLAGFIASGIVDNRGAGTVVDIALGVVGAVVGGFVFNLFGAQGVTGINVRSLFVAVLGAVIVLLVFHGVSPRRHTA